MSVKPKRRIEELHWFIGRLREKQLNEEEFTLLETCFVDACHAAMDEWDTQAWNTDVDVKREKATEDAQRA